MIMVLKLKIRCLFLIEGLKLVCMFRRMLVIVVIVRVNVIVRLNIWVLFNFISWVMF